MTITDILIASGLTQTDLSKRFKIPLRTVQSWCEGDRKPAPYILLMLEEILLDSRPEE